MCGILAISSSKKGQFDVAEITETDSNVKERNKIISIRGLYLLEEI